VRDVRVKVNDRIRRARHFRFMGMQHAARLELLDGQHVLPGIASVG
jgi:hypothetical protein